LRTLVPFPYASSERCGPVVWRDRSSSLIKAFRRSPDEVVSLRIRYGRSSFLEPYVIGRTAVELREEKVGSVGLSTGTQHDIRAVFFSDSSGSLVDDEVKDDLHPSGMSLFDQPVAVSQRAVFGVDVLVIGDIVSLIKSRTAIVISRLNELAQRAPMQVDYPYHIPLRALIVRRYPDRIDAEIMLKIIE
jgi:hypothetical protein